MADQQTAIVPASRPGIIAKFGERYDLDANKVLSIVANTVFRGSDKEPPLTNEEVAAALIVCNAYELNPFTKEIYAFRSKGKLLIVVGVDGWSTIVNRQAQLNGVEFEEHFDEKGFIHAVTCKIHRKDRALPTVVTEYTHECRRDTIPWQSMPIRMTRNRAFVQCARIAFSISGIVDDDEAMTIDGSPEFRGKPIDAQIDTSGTRTETVKQVIQHRKQRQQAEPSGADPIRGAGPAAQSSETSAPATGPDTSATAQNANEAPSSSTAATETQVKPEATGELW